MVFSDAAELPHLRVRKCRTRLTADLSDHGGREPFSELWGAPMAARPAIGREMPKQTTPRRRLCAHHRPRAAFYKAPSKLLTWTTAQSARGEATRIQSPRNYTFFLADPVAPPGWLHGALPPRGAGSRSSSTAMSKVVPRKAQVDLLVRRNLK